MFDLATRYAPTSLPQQALRIPFDWRLTVPKQQGYSGKNYSNLCNIQPYTQVLATYAMALEETLQTAVILSLFTDARSDSDDVLPRGQTDRRGWCGEELMRGDAGGAGARGARSESWGSRLWLIYASKTTDEVLDFAQFTAQEALAWMVRDGLAESVRVEAEWQGAPGQSNDRLVLRVSITRPGEIAPVYDVLWGTSIERGGSGLQSSVHEGLSPATQPPQPQATIAFIETNFQPALATILAIETNFVPLT